MNTLKTVLKAMLDIISVQNAQIAVLLKDMEIDNQAELTESDFADLQAQIATLMATPDTLG